MPPINNDWLEPLKPEFGKEYYKKLYLKVNEEYRNYEIFPAADDIVIRVLPQNYDFYLG